MNINLYKDLNENINITKQRLPIDDSFDIIGRDIKVGDRNGYLIFTDGFAKDRVMMFVVDVLQNLKREPQSRDYIKELIKCNISYIETNPFTTFEEMETAVLSGSVVLIVDGEEEGVIIDAREYPARSPEESEYEKVTGSSKDGFVETIVFNTALIRRRVRSPKLVFEMKNVGTDSKTDVCLAYLKDNVDEALLNNLRKKIDSIKIQSLIMPEKSLDELLLKKKWYNPLPQIKYTQRPDIAASYLYEGHILILADTSPGVMITPTTLFYFTQFAEDYYQNPLVGTYYRFIRFITMFVSLFLSPLWLLLAENQKYLPKFLSAIGAKEKTSIPLFVQFLILEFGFDLLRMSSLHTPNYLGGAFGIIGGLLLGEFAIKVGFFVPETIFYMALSAISLYCIPNIEFSSAMRIFRLFLLILTGFFGLWGFLAGILVIFIITATTETLDKRRKYLWPLIPFDGKALSRIIFRKPVTTQSNFKK